MGVAAISLAACAGRTPAPSDALTSALVLDLQSTTLPARFYGCDMLLPEQAPMIGTARATAPAAPQYLPLAAFVASVEERNVRLNPRQEALNAPASVTAGERDPYFAARWLHQRNGLVITAASAEKAQRITNGLNDLAADCFTKTYKAAQ